MTQGPQTVIRESPLTAKLRQLAVLRDQRDTAEAQKKDADRRYRRLESEVVEMMTADGLTSVKINGLGTFTVSSRNYTKVSDIVDFLKWATNRDGMLPNDVRINEDAGQVTLTFDVLRTLDPDAEDIEDDADRVVLVCGPFRCEVIKSILSEHVKELTASSHPHPPGIEPSIKTSIAIRRQR